MITDWADSALLASEPPRFYSSAGLVTIIGVAVATLLFLVESREYFVAPGHSQEMSVFTRLQDTIPLSFDVTFPAMPCTLLGIDILDVSGHTVSTRARSSGPSPEAVPSPACRHAAAQEIDISHDIYKQRLDSSGKPLTMEKPFRFDIDAYRRTKVRRARAADFKANEGEEGVAPKRIACLSRSFPLAVPFALPGSLWQHSAVDLLLPAAAGSVRRRADRRWHSSSAATPARRTSRWRPRQRRSEC